MATERNRIHTELTASDALTPTMDRAAQSIKRFDKSLNEANRGMRLIRGGGAQLSMQIQDIAVQLQGGTQFLTVFAQQGSQIASLFGANGAFIGAMLAVGAAIGNTFLPKLFQSIDASKEIDEAYQKLSKTLSIDFKGSISGVSEELKRAAAISENYAKVILAQNMATSLAKVTDNIGKYSEALAESNEEFTFANRPGFRMYSLDAHAEALGITRQELLKYKVATRSAVTGDQEAIKAYSDLTAELLAQSDAATEAGQRFIDLTIQDREFIQVADQARQQVDLSKKALNDLSGTLKNLDGDYNSARSEAESFVQSIDKQTAQIGMTKAQSIAYQASLLELNDTQHAIVATAIERALAEEELVRIKKEAEEATKNQTKADRELAALQKSIADGDLAALEIGAAALAQRKAKAEAAEREAAAMRKLFESLGLATGEESLQAQRDARLAKIQELVDSETDLEINAIELRRRAHEKYEEDIKKLRMNSTKFEERNIQGKTKFVLDDLGTMFQGISANNKKLFAVQKAYNIAQAIMSTYTGATKAIETYPPPLSFAMAAAQVAAGLGHVAQIKAQSFDGGGFTGSGSRSGGMDGKGGFPAILHPNETVVDHTKGQGQGITIINNVDARGAGPEVDIKIQQAMQMTSQQTIATVQDLMKRRRFA